MTVKRGAEDLIVSVNEGGIHRREIRPRRTVRKLWVGFNWFNW